MDQVDVIKINAEGREVWRYRGEVLVRNQGALLLQAHFDREDFLFHGMWLRRGDRFVEIYFADRWYNIFEIHDRDDEMLKGWYCNVTRPARFEQDSIAYEDMALDLLVFPDGRQVVLDEEEFNALDLDAPSREIALAALDELKGLFLPPIRIDLTRMVKRK